MKVELEEQLKYNADAWYVIRVDGEYFTGTGNKANADKMYNEIVADPTVIKTKRIILKSEEITLPLEETNQ
jgi:tRNA(His) 5'-end guanylyltransferase